MSLMLWTTLSIAFVCNAIGFVVSYLILYTDVLAKHRIQNRKYPKGIFFKRLPLISFNLATLAVLICVGMYFFHGIFTLQQTGWFAVSIQVFIMVFIDDTYFYFFHRNLHRNPKLYSKIHKTHHKAFAPFPMEYIYAHPLEWMGGAIGSFLGILLIFLYSGEVSAWAFWIFSVIRNLHEVDIHSGIKSKISDRIPLYGSTEHHDMHHLKATKGNYGSMLKFWDLVLGTTVEKKKTRFHN